MKCAQIFMILLCIDSVINVDLFIVNIKQIYYFFAYYSVLFGNQYFNFKLKTGFHFNKFMQDHY